MKKSLKGIIAGLVAMFAFAPVVFAAKISNIEVTIAAPEVGTKLEDEENPKPLVTLPDGATYKVTWTMYTSGLPSENPSYDDGSIFGTTVEAGKDYYLEVYLAPVTDGDTFDIELDPDTFEIAANNVTLTVNGGTDYELGYIGENQYAFFTKVTAGEAAQGATDEEETAATAAIEVLEGAAQKYDATGSDRLRFRFNLDYAAFKASGKIFVDGNEVDSKNYDSEEGSTIIIFTKAFTDTLKAGNHTLKLTSDEGEVETTFNVTKAVANPQTGDNIYAYVSLAVISLLGLAVSKKKLFN